MKLYEITEELHTAIERYTNSTDDAEMQTLAVEIANIHMAFKDKVIACGYYCLNQESDIESIDREITRLKAMKQSKENSVERLKNYLKMQMENNFVDKIDHPALKIAIRKNPISVVVDNEESVPDEYKRVKMVTSVDKTAIAEAHKNGMGVNGTHIEQKTRLDIR